MSNVNPQRFSLVTIKHPLTTAKLFRQCFINTGVGLSGDSSVIVNRFHRYHDMFQKVLLILSALCLMVSEHIHYFTQSKAKQNKTKQKQNKTKQSKTKKTKQNKTKQSKAKQNKAKQSKAKQSKESQTKQNKAKQNKTKHPYSLSNLGSRGNKTKLKQNTILNLDNNMFQKKLLTPCYVGLRAQNKTKQNKTKQNKTKQNKNKQTKQNKTKQNKQNHLPSVRLHKKLPKYYN